MHQLSPMVPALSLSETDHTLTPSWDGIPVVDIKSDGLAAPILAVLQRHATFAVIFSISAIHIGIGWLAYRLFHLLSPDVQRAFLASSDVRWTIVVGACWVLGLLVVASAVIEALASLDMSYPKVDKEKLAELDEARKALSADKESSKKKAREASA